MMNVRHLSLVLAATVVLAAAPPSPSAPAARVQAQIQAQQPVRPKPPASPEAYAPQDLRIGYFTPRRADPENLFDIARGLFGRTLKVSDRDQITGISNLHLFGNSLVIHETPEALSRIQEELAKLDADYQGLSHREELEVFRYSPRFVPVVDLVNALRPFQRNVRVDDSNRQNNIHLALEQGTIFVRDTRDRLQEIRKAIESVDVPSPQVRITCFLLRGGRPSGEEGGDTDHDQGAVDAVVPRELSDNLASIVPYDSFELLGVALVQSTLKTQRQISLLVQVGDDQGCMLEMDPEAYDASSKTLSLGACHVTQMRRNEQGGFDEVQEILSTSIRLPAGEYTVLGATGEQPIFIALRMEPLAP